MVTKGEELYCLHPEEGPNAYMYHIHSNKHPGCKDKLFQVGAYLFQYLLQRFGHFQANSQSYLIQIHVSFMNRFALMFDYFMVYSFKI